MIEINNLTTAVVDEKFLKKVAKIVLGGKSDLSIALVGQTRIRELNKRYRGKNKATDVLAFPYGEIVICPSETKELNRVLIHGILHLLGFNHKQMKIKEDHYLSKI